MAYLKLITFSKIGSEYFQQVYHDLVAYITGSLKEPIVDIYRIVALNLDLQHAGPSFFLFHPFG
jgi:hypothetical protein